MATLVGQPGEGAALRGFVEGDGPRTIVGRFDARRWIRSAAGGQRVAAELATLPDDYMVFNDFRPAPEDTGRSARSIDHIVFGPRGVFVIETRNSARSRIGAASNDIWNRRAVRQARSKAMDLQLELTAWSGGILSDLFVVPIVVYTREGTRVVQLREGAVSVVPLGVLKLQILGLRGSPIGAYERSCVAEVLFNQLEASARVRFEPAMALYRRRVQEEPPDVEVAVAEKPAAARRGELATAR